jgi:hypothetical protein
MKEEGEKSGNSPPTENEMPSFSLMRFQAPLVTLLRATSVNIKAVVWMTFVILFFEKLRANIKMKRFNLFCSWAAPYPDDADLFQRGCGSRPEILDQKWSPGSSVWGKDFIFLVSFLCRSFTLDWNLFPSFFVWCLLPCSLTSTRSLPVCGVTSFESLSKATSTLVSVSGRISSSTSRYCNL